MTSTGGVVLRRTSKPSMSLERNIPIPGKNFPLSGERTVVTAISECNRTRSSRQLSFEPLQSLGKKHGRVLATWKPDLGSFRARAEELKNVSNGRDCFDSAGCAGDGSRARAPAGISWQEPLTKDAYLAVQPIYYPGFTIAGGIGEVGGLIAVLAIVLLTRQDTPAFWLRLVALAAMLGMQAVFWLFTQPVNKFWLQGAALGSFGHKFFDVRPGAHRVSPNDPDAWKKMRDRWECSHIARAGLAAFGFLLLVVAAVTED
jgi:hypothetical protein